MKLTFIKKHIITVCGIIISIFLFTTSFQNIQNQPLQSITADMLPNFALNQAHVLIHAKVMSSDESKRNFGHDLLSRGIKPLHLSIQNNTSHEYSMCASSVDLPRIEPNAVVSKVTRSALARTIGYKILGFFFWPVMIPGTIDGIRVMMHRKKLKKDILAKSLRQEVLAPYAIFNRVLFVPDNQLQNSFQITLIDLETLQPTELEMTISDN